MTNFSVSVTPQRTLKSRFFVWKFRVVALWQTVRKERCEKVKEDMKKQHTDRFAHQIPIREWRISFCVLREKNQTICKSKMMHKKTCGCALRSHPINIRRFAWCSVISGWDKTAWSCWCRCISPVWSLEDFRCVANTKISLILSTFKGRRVRPTATGVGYLTHKKNTN